MLTNRDNLTRNTRPETESGVRTNLHKSTSRRSRAAMVAAALAASAMMLGAGGCHPPLNEGALPIAVRVPVGVATKVNTAQSAFVNALSTVTTHYDQAVCQAKNTAGDRAFSRQAVAEANLEVAQALVAARTSTQARGGGPADPGDGIIFIEEPAPAQKSYGAWTCTQAVQQPACVEATANYVGRQVYRVHVAGYDLNPVTVGDVLEAFAADLRWADAYLNAAETPAQGFRALSQACEAGESPLARFFEAAADFDHIRVRDKLRQLQADFVGTQKDVCAALPIYYDRLLQELNTSLARHTRTQQCASPPWNILS